MWLIYSVGPDQVCSIESQVIWTVIVSKRGVDLERANVMQIDDLGPLLTDAVILTKSRLVL